MRQPQFALLLAFLLPVSGWAQGEEKTARLPDPQKLLQAEKFWENRDFSWYQANIPFFECPDSDIQTTWYYRWELLTRHLTYGSPNSGYSFTEFIDRPFWSGAYGAISCPAGHQLQEARWLKDRRYAWDYARYWHRTPGAQPRNYSTWLADATWRVHQVHPNQPELLGLLPDLRRNHEGWRKRHFDPAAGLYWQSGHDDGMEFNINSRQTLDILRGAPGYRPTLSVYLWADALAIAKVADLSGDKATAASLRAEAAGVKENLQAKLWDPRRSFFFPMLKSDEVDKEGVKMKAGSLTYQTGKHAGSEYGRELIGYVPWQFGLPDKDKGYEKAWARLMDADGFLATFGPTTVERKDPLYLLQKWCCWWSGQSWPYATAQTLQAMANLLIDYPQGVVSRDDYIKLLSTFAKTHRKNGKPYLAEAANPDTGSFEGHDGYNHSEHYFHSSYCDLVVTGLAGIRPGDDGKLVVDPLAPAAWAYFALTDLPYRNHRLDLVWDKAGDRYGLGKGLHLLVGGKVVASRPDMGRLELVLPESPMIKRAPDPVNFAVNNDGTYYPRVSVSSTSEGSVGAVNDGNAWYDRTPPNRWVAAPPRESDTVRADPWVEIDLGMTRLVSEVRVHLLEDAGLGIVPPARINLEVWDGQEWKPVAGRERQPALPTGRQANRILFEPIKISRARVTLQTVASGGPASGGTPKRHGLTELELWGQSSRPVATAPPPKGNLASNPSGKDFPRASASFTSRYDKVGNANDGIVSFNPQPANRWTTYESKSATDWLEIDLGQVKKFSRVELAIYDDRGGVQAPEKYTLEIWDGNAWQPLQNEQRDPPRPTGGQYNSVRFTPVEAAKLRATFTHKGQSRSGLSEIFVWE